MFACICFGVTEDEVKAEITLGARTEEEIGERCGAGTGCGTCLDRIGALLRAAGTGRDKMHVEAAA